FQIPQFIEVEDKIFGPLTFKQFIYLVGGGGISFVLYSVLPFFLAILLIIPVVGLSLALAFYKINNKPFIGVLEAAFRYALGNKLYIWKKSDRAAIHKEESITGQSVYVPKISDSKLKDLSWSLDVHQKIR
ncbi:MAG: PrgI family protein, partial [Patescibacteria group bacterium]